MTSIENKRQALALVTLEDSGFTREQAEAIASAIRLLTGDEPSGFPARVLKFEQN
jgi:hypothetical protein